ncbi:MAG: efflux RND transporter permease subunit [Opitutales bacterium]
MTLYSLSIRRPVLAIVMSTAIVSFGILGFTFLGVREYPSVDPPVISVSTSYGGANAEIVESQITIPIEEAVNAVAGITSITSTSREGRSTVRLEFDLDSDLETAANDVRDRVSRAIRRLPPDADPPRVSKADADSRPIIFLNISSPNRDLLELSRIADDDFKPRFETIPGVSEVNIWGEKRYSMRLWMDPLKMAAYGLTALDVRQVLSRENVELPSGRIDGDSVELSVRTLTRLSTPEEFNDIILKRTSDGVVRFSDIGTAELGAHNDRTILKRDGVPMVGVVLRPQPGANQIDIADEFYQRLEQIKRNLPADIRLGIGFDTSQFVRESIAEVKQTIVIALALVVLIIFVFLRDVRTTIIPVIVIPISLISTFFIMYLAGFSINVLTLLGIILAIGLVVDDAIIVLENIYAKIEKGLHPLEAGITGTREIFFAVISTSLALVAVFLPILFLGGITGRLFREFGVVLGGAVVVSSFVALTLTPMLSTRILKRGAKGHSRIYYWTEPFFAGLGNLYKKALEGFMQWRWTAFLIMGAALGLVYFFFSSLPSELAPYEDRSRIRLSATAPEGASFEYMENYMNRLVSLVQEAVPEHEAIISNTSPGFGASSSVNSGSIHLILKKPHERTRTQTEIADDLTIALERLSGARTSVSQDASIGGSRGGLPVQFVLLAPSMERIEAVLPEFLDAARADPAFSFVDTNLRFNKPEVQVEIDRERARALGISALDIGSTLQAALSEQRYGFFIMDGKQYEVIGQLTRENRNTPHDLRSIYVNTIDGNPVQLDNLVNIRETSAPPILYRFDRYTSATISANLSPGMSIGDGIAAMEAIAADLLDESFSTTLTGASKDYVDSATSLFYVFLLALFLVYLVLAAQFESFRDPLVIMFTVPLALAGALFSLWFFGQTLNIFSQIGLIMLIGLVTKNGILIVEFANQRKATGLTALEAVKDAAYARFRPVLMTSLSTVLGVLPIALSLGAGSESRVSMAVGIIGGLIFGSILTLFVIPATYSFITSARSQGWAEDAEKEVAKHHAGEGEKVLVEMR